MEKVFNFVVLILKIKVMKKNYLLPNKFKIIGLVIFILGLVQFFAYDCGWWYLPSIKVFGVITDDGWFKVISNDFDNELSVLSILIGLLFMALSKERDEDEMTVHLRGESFVWSLWVTILALIVVELFVYEGPYLIFFYSAPYLFTFIYVCRFNFKVFRLRRGFAQDCDDKN